MVRVDEQKLYDYIKLNLEHVDDMPIEDVVLMVMGAYHLETLNDCRFSINTAITGTSVITMLFATGPLLIAGSITASIAGCVGLFKNNMKERKINKLKDALIDNLMHRYPTFLEAYVEIGKIVENTETEDLLDFFKKADAYNE